MFDLNKLSTVKSDSSDSIISKVLLQLNSQSMLYFVAYFSICMISAKCNYDIYDKELLIIICTFEK